MPNARHFSSGFSCGPLPFYKVFWTGENTLDQKMMGPTNSTNAIDLHSCNTGDFFLETKIY